MADAILPILDDIIARGVNRLIARRPSAGPFVVSGKGRYFDVFAGWKSQLVLLRERLADECASRRLPTSEARSLVELAASEFFAELLPTATTAVGAVTFERPTTDAGAGVIKQGTRLRVDADPTVSPEIKAARYVTTAPQYVRSDDLVVGPVPIEASSPGTDANLPRYVFGSPANIVLDDTLFDKTFTVTGSSAAGGSTGVRDSDIRRLATALYTGQQAPTDGALIAGALTDAAVKHVTLVRDRALGQSVLFIADESWAWSLAFQNQCKQTLKEQWLGWGARVDVRPIQNRLVTVYASVVLADPKFKDDTAELAAIIRETVRTYLDERPDFYTFDLNAIGGLIAAVDPRVLTCTSASLINISDGLPTTPAVLTADSEFAERYFLVDNGVNLTLVPPS